MEELPQPTEPEYKSWPLEKLQAEYFKKSAECVRLKLMVSNAQERNILVDDFLLSFRMLVEHDEKE